MKKTIIRLALFAAVFSISGVSLVSCSKNDDVTSPTNNPGNPNPGNPGTSAPEFDALKNLEITITDVEYTPGSSGVYVNYHVKNKHTTQRYDVSNEDDWDIVFKVKATDGYEYTRNVLVFTVEAESDYNHGVSIDVSTGKTIDLSTLKYELIQNPD